MIEMRSVVKRFGDVEALADVSFAVPEGSLTVLIGPSGCGKSTSLRLINRLVDPTSGEVIVNGRRVSSVRPELLRRGIGYVIQSVGLLPHLSVAENVGIVPRLLKWERGRIRRRVDELLDLVGLDPERYPDKHPSQLSGGEAQRVGVARALAADPPILLMDEPFGAVDPLNRETLQDEFAAIQSKLRKTVVFVTHDLDEAVRLADQIVLLRAGRVVQIAAPEEILEHPADDFAQDFVGSDRVLKRLARFSVRDYVRQTDATLPADPGARRPYVASSSSAPARPLWRVDQAGRLVGLSLQERPEETCRPPEPFWVHEGGTLREALSLLLYLHVTRVAVVDDGRRVVGEVALETIHEVTRREAGEPESPRVREERDGA